MSGEREQEDLLGALLRSEDLGDEVDDGSWWILGAAKGGDDRYPIGTEQKLMTF